MTDRQHSERLIDKVMGALTERYPVTAVPIGAGHAFDYSDRISVIVRRLDSPKEDRARVRVDVIRPSQKASYRSSGACPLWDDYLIDGDKPFEDAGPLLRLLARSSLEPSGLQHVAFHVEFKAFRTDECANMILEHLAICDLRFH